MGYRLAWVSICGSTSYNPSSTSAFQNSQSRSSNGNHPDQLTADILIPMSPIHSFLLFYSRLRLVCLIADYGHIRRRNLNFHGFDMRAMEIFKNLKNKDCSASAKITKSAFANSSIRTTISGRLVRNQKCCSDRSSTQGLQDAESCYANSALLLNPNAYH